MSTIFHRSARKPSPSSPRSSTCAVQQKQPCSVPPPTGASVVRWSLPVAHNASTPNSDAVAKTLAQESQARLRAQEAAQEARSQCTLLQESLASLQVNLF